MHKGFYGVSLVRCAVTFFPLTLFLSLGGIAGCKTRSYNSAPKLIGGREAKEGEFPGVLQIARGCTASLIGRRHILTAGHCVLVDYPVTGKANVVKYSRGHKLPVNARLVQGEGETTALVESVSVHPSYLEFNSSDTSTWDAVSDLAVITLQSDFYAVAPIRVDFSPIRAGERIQLLGFGCQKDSRGGKDTDTGRIELKTGQRKVIAVFEKTFTTLREDDDEKEEAKKVVQLCPGDSGGPVLTLASGKFAVKGVNAYTQADFITGFARLDAGAESWLKGLVPDLNAAHASGARLPAPPTQPAPPAPTQSDRPSTLGTENWDSVQRTRCDLLAEDIGIPSGSWTDEARCLVRLRTTATLAVLELVDEETGKTLGTSVEGVPTSSNVSFSFAGGREWKVSTFEGELRSVIGSSKVFMMKRSQ